MSGGGELWVHPAVWLGGTVWGTWKGDLDHDAIARPYELIRHVEEMLEQRFSEHDRTNAIVTLRRAVDIRVRRLEALYGLNDISMPTAPRKLERLCHVGLIKPRHMEQLRLMRNDIEHNDAQPPLLDRCLELAEVVWYFIRATDVVASGELSSIEVATPLDDGGFVGRLDISTPPICPSVAFATLAGNITAAHRVPTWIATRFESIVESTTPDGERELEVRGGTLLDPAEVMTDFVRRYFEVARLA